MLGVREHHQVFGTVVKTIPVDVVDVLVMFKAPTQQLFHDVTVFEDIAAIAPDAAVLPGGVTKSLKSYLWVNFPERGIRALEAAKTAFARLLQDVRHYVSRLAAPFTGDSQSFESAVYPSGLPVARLDFAFHSLNYIRCHVREDGRG